MCHVICRRSIWKRKRCQDGSVEKYRAPEDHEVVGQNDEGEFADLSPATSRPDVVSESAFDHWIRKGDGGQNTI